METNHLAERAVQRDIRTEGPTESRGRSAQASEALVSASSWVQHPGRKGRVIPLQLEPVERGKKGGLRFGRHHHLFFLTTSVHLSFTQLFSVVNNTGKNSTNVAARQGPIIYLGN